MIKYQALTQYSRVVDSVMFPQDIKSPFMFLYFSENSSLVDDYPRLKLRKMDYRFTVIPVTKIPVTRLTGELRQQYKSRGLLSYNSNMVYPKNKNVIFDISYYLSEIDEIYKPKTYRQRAGYLLKNILLKSFSSFTENYKKILVYSVDLTKPLNSFPNRKIFPILWQLKEEEIYYDDVLFVLLDGDGARYRLLVKEKDYNFGRVYNYLKNIRPISTEEEKEEEVQSAADKIVDKVKTLIPDGDITKVKSSVRTFLRQKPDEIEKIRNDEMDDVDVKKLTIASIFNKTSGDLDRATTLAATVNPKTINNTLTRITKQFSDDILKKEDPINHDESVMVQSSNIPVLVSKKTPEHIFEKRKIDFELNLKKDMVNAFKVLENRDIPLVFDSLKVEDKPPRAGELNKSDEATIIINLADKKKKIHTIKIDIPKINPTSGTFRVNGKTKLMINQIVLNPICFPKVYDSKFESSYSSFHIYSKRTKKLKYLEIYMGSFRLPFSILLMFSFGFAETLKQYSIAYHIVDKKPDEKFFMQAPNGSYIVFDKVDTELKEELITSLINAKINTYNTKQEFLSKSYFNDIIIQMTGRVDSTYLISNNLDNIVDSIVRQVLINQQLPFELSQIMYYMASKVVTGFVQDRNDITNQRIRNSEVLVHLSQKQLLKTYTEYREQYLAGNEDAKLNFPQQTILSQFINLEIVQDMEYANPVEEMASLTKISPVGKTVGGIPDKRAITLDARNVHPTYFGNIDPLDTSESDNIGITQQLTVDAYITSARGLFGIKPISNNEKSGILSTTLSMVPFIENNEGARMIMTANQSKQMLPLKNPEAPIVQTGYEGLLTNVLSDNFIKRAPCGGKVIKITVDFIDILCKEGKVFRVELIPRHLKSGSGRNTLSTFTPTVKEGQVVKLKQMIAEGSCISGGTISLGRNLAVCYMPYKGYNFEDGVVISDRLVKEDQLTSLHGVEIEASIEDGDKVLFISELGKETKKGEPLLRKIPANVEELISIDEDQDEELDTYGGQIIVKSPGGKIVDIEILSNLSEEKYPLLKGLISRTDKKYKKPGKEKYTDRGVPIRGMVVKFKVEQELGIGLGDKLCNRYGNKGIISLIEKAELMPRTPWGESVDIVINPLGVINRMNIGQLYEVYCGFISKTVSNKILQMKSRTDIIKLIELVTKGLDTSNNQKNSMMFINNLKKLSDSQFKLMIEQTRTSGFIPIVIPPFQGPNYKQILPVLRSLGLKETYHMTLPEFHTKTRNPVPFGYTYISKLEHIGEFKAHARSTGPMVGKTLQPTSGKRREGGQRMGEGDTWALASYNCPKLISEFFGPLSDDGKTKNEMIAEIYQTGSAKFRKTKTSPTKSLLNAYFIGLMLSD